MDPQQQIPQQQPFNQPTNYPPTPDPQQINPQSGVPLNQDPGKTLGIVGFVFAFIGLQLIGLILSIIGLKRSKRAGFKNTLAFAGVILNSIILGLAIILVPILVSITITSYNGITARANSSSAQAAAANVVKNSELYQMNNGAYPTTAADLSDSVTGVEFSDQAITSEPYSPSTVEFSSCGTEGNKIGYWDYDEEEVAYIYSGTATASSSCALATN